MKVVAIVQARLGSQRLPKKVLLPLEDRTVLGHVIQRLRHCKNLNEIVVATSVDPEDKKIVNWCKDNNVSAFCGSLHDVLDRYYKASCYYNADAIVRITADCPVIDPETVDNVVEGYLNGKYDAYSLLGEFPDGLDCQVFNNLAIKKAWNEARLPSEREHVGIYIEKTHRDLFILGGLNKFNGLSHHRWTLDEPRDYDFLKQVFSRLYKKKKIFDVNDILDLLKKEPELMNINSGIIRNSGYLKSKNEEKTT
jgi:spore coat polysaccharide biosynthesis protein SpsF